MPTFNPLDLPPTGRWLAIDRGAKTLGLAISDSARRLATARATLKRSKWATEAATLRDMIAADGITALVVGYPVNMDGSLGPQADIAQSFAHQAEKDLGLPVLLWDERLTTQAAALALADQGIKRRDHKTQQIDSLAAVLLLQTALDSATA